ncbi:MAG: hypothetical protein WCJ81_02650 [bacterium]
MKTFAGLILNIRNAKSVPVIMPKRVVARYHLYVNVATAKTHNTITIIHPAKPSNPSVIFRALTIAIVKKNVRIG